MRAIFQTTYILLIVAVGLFFLIPAAARSVASSNSSSPCHLVILSPCQGGSLIYSTYVGGTAWDEGSAIAVGGDGSAYLTGHTQSVPFPGEGGTHGVDVHGVKVNPAGSTLDYAFWINAASLFAEDYGKGIAVGPDGSAYIVGDTRSEDFCEYFGTVPGYDTTYNGDDDGFALKVKPDGSGLDYCTYLGGNDVDIARAVAIDSQGNAYITGGTWSADFPTTAGAYDISHNGLRDTFVLKLSADGLSLTYSTLLGGSNQEEAAAIALDSSNNAYVTGWTSSSNFPTTPGAYDTSYGNNFDAFVTKVNGNGTSLSYSTYLGGTQEDRGGDIVIAADNTAVVAGHTQSTNFPTTPGAFDISHNGGIYDAFVTHFNAAGSALATSTFVGGNQEDQALGLDLDNTGRPYLTGVTWSANFPTTADAFDTTLGGDKDAFVTVLDASAASLAYSTYLGGADPVYNWDEGFDIAVDAAGNAYVTGQTQAPDFPTTVGAYDTTHNGDYDIFVSKLALGGGPTPTPSATFTPSPIPTNTPTPTPTYTPTAGPSPTPTNTLTPTVTPEPLWYIYLPGMWR